MICDFRFPARYPGVETPCLKGGQSLRAKDRHGIVYSMEFSGYPLVLLIHSSGRISQLAVWLGSQNGIRLPLTSS